MIRASTVVGLVALAGCGGRSEAEAPAPALAKRWCPPPVEWRQDRPWPMVLEVTNSETEEVAVFLDGCDHHERAMVIRPGQKRVVRLPTTVYAYGGSLRFHWFHTDRPTSLATVDLPLASAARGRLRLALPVSSSSGCDLQIAVDSVLGPEGQWRTMARANGEWHRCGSVPDSALKPGKRGGG